MFKTFCMNLLLHNFNGHKEIKKEAMYLALFLQPFAKTAANRADCFNDPVSNIFSFFQKELQHQVVRFLISALTLSPLPLMSLQVNLFCGFCTTIDTLSMFFFVYLMM